MAKELANVSFRIDSKLKEEADSLFEDLGLNMTTAFNIFLRQCIASECIPFKITKTSKEKGDRDHEA